jgi:hypothetical protein
LRGRRRIDAAEKHAYLIVIEGTCEVAGEPTRAGEGWYVAPGCDVVEVNGNATGLLVAAP